jgi:hypothetical protein
MYFFQIEEYQKSLDYFEKVKDYVSKITQNQILCQDLYAYTADLDSYLIACKSMLNIEIDINLQQKINDHYSNQVVKKINLIENSIKNNFKVYYLKQK